MRKKKIKRPITISETTVSRRTLLDWMGKATVLSLGGNLLTACELFPRLNPQTFNEPGDGQFDFTPNEEPLLVSGRWRQRTVDPQTLTDIIATWQLRVDGLVEQPALFSFHDLISLPRQNQITDFHCVEGWSVLDIPWNGLHMSSLFDIVNPLPEASHITFYSIGDIFLESIPFDISLEESTMLAYGINESTIPLKRGFPLRLVIPRLLGYKNSKYLYRIELTDHKVEGYWVEKGYPYKGEVPPRRLRDGKY